MSGVTFADLLVRGWPVLGSLLLMSVLSLAVILNRFFVFKGTRLDAREFVHSVARAFRSGSAEEAARLCARYPQPVAVACGAIVGQRGGRDARERALQHALLGETQRLEAYVPILATIASTAPFIGLLGTVIGIIRAFSDISTNLEGGPGVVAAGIAEALVSTAAGLVVAIPAVVAYNYFVRRAERLVDEIDLAAYELIETITEEPAPRS
jgi:biopolymer transport protein ExbB/TolQ